MRLRSVRVVDARERLRSEVFHGEIEREHAAFVGDAHDVDRASEEPRDLATDGEAETRAAVLSTGRPVRLLEGLEDELLLLRRDADARVADGERDHARALLLRRLLHRHRDAALGGELERVRQEVLQDLLETADVREERMRQRPDHLDLEREVLLFRDVAERLLEIVAYLAETERLRVDGHLAGLDLRQVEDLVDQREEVVAGRVDRLGKLHLLRGEVPVAVLREHLRQDEQAVERRAQLVAHVGEELGLVLGD